jgi:hypothetical protein
MWYNEYVIKSWEALKNKKQKEVDTMTNTSRKPTKRDHFNALLAINEVASNPALVEFIEHELDLLNRKNTAERKPTAKQVENAGYKEAILAYFEPDVLYSCADVTKGCPACVEAGLSAQRVSALLGQLVDAGSLTKMVEKRKTFYSLA